MPLSLSAPIIMHCHPQRHHEREPHCQELELDDQGADDGCDRCGLEPQLEDTAGDVLGFPFPPPFMEAASFSSSH